MGRNRRQVRVVVLVLGLLVAAACTKGNTTTSNEASGTNAGAGSPATGGANPSNNANTNPAADRGGNQGGNRPAGDAPPVQKLQGPITVLAFGDSLTEGAGDDESRGYPFRLQNALAERGHAGSNVVKLGLSGWTSKQMIDGTEDVQSQLIQAQGPIDEAKAAGRPIVANILIGSNDLWYLYANDAPTTEEEERQDLEAYRANLQRAVSTLRGAGAQVVLAINDDQSKRPVMTDETLRRDTFPAISADEVKQMSVQARKYADVVRQVAAENGAVVADFLDAPFMFDRATLADDGSHPNTRGYDEMTKVWLAAMQPLL